MECLYDTLFECDCAGIEELYKVKCLGTWDTNFLTRSQFGIIAGAVPTVDPKLRKRIEWLARCGNLAGFYLIALDEWKTNLWKLFLKVTTVWEWIEYQGIWRPFTKHLEPPSCYYLGRYPWYWNLPNNHPAGPYTAYVGPNMVFNFTPEYPGKPFIYHDIITDPAREFFYKPEEIKSVRAQERFIKERTNLWKNCIAREYPKPTQKPRRLVETPIDVGEWPGKPVTQLTPPTPYAPPSPPWVTRENVLRATMLMGFTPPNRPDGLLITVTIY